MSKLFLSLSLALFGFASTLTASVNSHEVDHNSAAVAHEQIFILQGESEPVLVVPEDRAQSIDSKYMKMPTLNHDSAESGLAYKQKKSNTSQEKHTSAITNKLPAAPKAKPLQFASTKIAGKVRLPRVKFAKIGVPMELRDEMPSLDFTGKSLTSGGL